METYLLIYGSAKLIKLLVWGCDHVILRCKVLLLCEINLKNLFYRANILNQKSNCFGEGKTMFSKSGLTVPIYRVALQRKTMHC